MVNEFGFCISVDLSKKGLRDVDWVVVWDSTLDKRRDEGEGSIRWSMEDLKNTPNLRNEKFLTDRECTRQT